MPRHRLTLLLFACLPLWALAQGKRNPEAPSLAYTTIRYSDENGLPQNSIKDIARDRYGFIWLASEAGLIRYDGKQFQLFTKDEMGTKHARIYTMGRWTPGGELFAVTEAWDYARTTVDGCRPIFTGLPFALSDKGLVQRFKEPIAFGPTQRFHLFAGNNPKTLLVPIHRDSFYLVNHTNTQYDVRLGVADSVLWTTRISGEKAKWDLYWQNHKLYLYNKNAGQFFCITQKGVRFEASVPPFQKLIWNKAEEQTFILTHNNELQVLFQSPSGKLTAKPIFRDIPADFEVESAYYMEKEGLIILGSLRSGLLVCKKKNFASLYANRPHMQSVFYGIYPTDDDMIITDQGELLDREGNIHNTKLKLDSKKVNFPSVARSKEGKFLIASGDSLLAYSPDGKKVPPIVLDDEIGAITTDREGLIWVATQDSGIFMIGEDRIPQKMIELDQKIIISFMKELVTGLLFIGTDNGLYIYNKQKRITNRFPHTERYYIRNIFLSIRDKLYLCTYGDGLIMLDGNGMVPLPTDKREYLKMAHCVMQDKKGRLWITTNKGLFCVPETDLIRYAEGKTRYVYYYHLGKENGFATNEFNGGCQPCGVRMMDGDLVFPSLNGLVLFNPDSALFNFPQRGLQVKAIAVNDTVVPQVGDTLSVTRDFKRIEIFLTTPLFDPDQNLFVEYTFDSSAADSWAPMPLSGPLTFTSVHSGYSTLTFRLKGGFGVSEYRYLELTLYKPKALWEWPIFWPGVLVFLLAVLYVYLRVRTRNLNRRNVELSEAVEQGRRELLETINSLTETSGQLERKNRFQQWLISSVVHDLRGPLRFIKFYGNIKKEDEEATAEKFSFLKSVYFSAQKIYTYSENLIQLLRIEQNSDFPPEKTDFAQLAEDKIDQFHEQVKWNGVSIVLQPDSDPFLFVNNTALSIIVQNLLDNSVKNLKNGNIYLSLKNEGHQAIVSIRDEGTGLSPELLQRFNRPVVKDISGGHSSGIGLWLVRSLVMQTGGHIRFENVTEPDGLLVTLVWPQPEQA